MAALVFCHAGCTVEDIMTAMGLTVRNLMPDHNSPIPTREGNAGVAAKTFGTANEAVAELERGTGGGRHSDISRCGREDASGWWSADITDGKKEIRPVSRHGDVWPVGGARSHDHCTACRDWRKRSESWWSKARSAQDAARALGFIATTSAGGANAAAMTDWEPLAGKEVWILRDADGAGENYSGAVATMLSRLTPVPVVKELDPHMVWERDLLPKGFDIADAVAVCKDEEARLNLRQIIEIVAYETPAWRPADRTCERESMIRNAVARRMEPDLIRLSDVEPKEVPWLWRSQVPRVASHLIISRPAQANLFSLATRRRG